MLPKLFGHMRHNVVAYLALFVALGGTSAYAANTVFSTDIVDNQVFSADVRDDTLSGGGLGSIDIRNGEMTTNEIRDDTQAFGGLFSQDLAAGSVRTSEVADSSLTGTDIADGSLGGGDIVESSLNMPPTTTVGFASISSVVHFGNSMTWITGRNLPPGHYSAVATVNIFNPSDDSDQLVEDTCELRGPNNNYIGGAKDGRLVPANRGIRRSLSMNGAAQITTSGTGIGLYCSTNATHAASWTDYGQIMITKLDGFF